MEAIPSFFASLFHESYTRSKYKNPQEHSRQRQAAAANLLLDCVCYACVRVLSDLPVPPTLCLPTPHGTSPFLWRACARRPTTLPCGRVASRERDGASACLEGSRSSRGDERSTCGAEEPDDRRTRVSRARAGCNPPPGQMETHQRRHERERRALQRELLTNNRRSLSAEPQVRTSVCECRWKKLGTRSTRRTTK